MKLFYLEAGSLDLEVDGPIAGDNVSVEMSEVELTVNPLPFFVTVGSAREIGGGSSVFTTAGLGGCK